MKEFNQELYSRIKILICILFVFAWIFSLVFSPNTSKFQHKKNNSLAKVENFKAPKSKYPKEKLEKISFEFSEISKMPVKIIQENKPNLSDNTNKPKEEAKKEEVKKEKIEKKIEISKSDKKAIESDTSIVQTNNPKIQILVLDTKMSTAEESKNLIIPQIINLEQNTPRVNSKSVASETLKALEESKKPKEKTVPANNIVSLRQRIESPTKNVIAKYPSTATKDKWVPRYLVEKSTLEFGKEESLEKDPDDVVSQLEFIGIIKNPDGSTVAIIKDKSNNKIEFLKRGDQYQGLKLVNLNSNDVTLTNIDLEKTYTKKLKNSK